MASITTETRAAAGLDGILANINGAGAGSLRIYSGSAPATVAAPATGTLLADCAHVDGMSPMFGSTNTTTLVATGATSGGVFASDSSANATGTAGYWRIYDSSGVAALQGGVGGPASGAELELSTTSIVAGSPVTITSFTMSISGIY